ncbi:unnamed protein product [Alopecurus aequalis]
MSTVGTAWSGRLAHDGSIKDKVVLDLNRSPVAEGVDCENEDPVAAGTRASPVAVNLDRSLVAAGACVAGGEGSQDEASIAADKLASPVAVDLDRFPVTAGACVAGDGGSQDEAPIAADTQASPIVVDLDRSPIAGVGGSQNVAPIAAGTQDAPIDVEALDDEGRRNGTGTRRRHRHPMVVVDLEADTDQQGHGAARTRPCSLLNGSKRRRVPPVICISPDREERASNKRKTLVPVSRSCVNVAPKEPVFTCPVCLNQMEQPSATSCGHVFCEKCIKSSIKAQKKCPTCRRKLGPRGFRRVYLPATTDQS